MLDQLVTALSDRYAIERELGRGGMATVWLARDIRLDRPVAIKVLHPELAGVIGVDRFVREIRLTARLQHSNIVPVLDAGTFTGAGGITLPWYTMGYVAGESLRARLDRERQLPLDDALRITADTAAALDAAHQSGIVHRDIKPENLLLAGDRTWVADFGIAKALVETGGDRLTSTGLAVGTPAYMSPEQASADTVDARTDQYSLASVLYEMLAGEPPYTGPTAQAIIARRMSGPPRPIRPIRPAVPAAVEAAVLRAMEWVPTDRFATLPDFIAALHGEAPVAGTLRRAAWTPLIPRRHAGRMARVLGGGVLFVVLAGGGLLFANRKARAPTDPEVVALYQRGMRAYDRRTPAGAAEAIDALGAAIGRDSSYAPAWAGLAKAYVQAYGRGFLSAGSDSVLRLAVAAGERALALDPHSADALATQAQVNRLVDPTDMSSPLALLRRSLAIDSTGASAWHNLAVSLADSGDLAAAIGAWRRSVAADPGYAQGIAFLALGHYWRRQYDSAAHWADSALAVDPTYLLARTTVGQIAVERGNFTRARAAFEAARRLTSDVEIPNVLAGAALAEARRGNRTEARRLMREADALNAPYAPILSHNAVYPAHAHAALGNVDAAVALLSAYSPRDGLHFQLHLRCDPPFDALVQDQRFQALLVMPRPPAGTGC